MLVQGLRSDLMTLGLFAAPTLVLLPPLLAIRRVTWWIRACCAWLGVSLIAIIFLEFATPQFLIEYDSRPNRLFLEYLVYPHEVHGDAVERLSRPDAAHGCGALRG